MYSIDEHDRVVALSDLPRSSVGAPLPIVVAAEARVILAYLVEAVDPAWDGRTVRIVTHDAADEILSLVAFTRPYAHYFGPPNDEAFAGHPLAKRGLHPCGTFEIEQSSWIRQLAELNSVHPHHDARRFSRLRHFVFAFHDSIFECIAEDLHIDVRGGSIASAATELSARLFEPAT
jgi:hypothetical protein